MAVVFLLGPGMWDTAKRSAADRDQNQAIRAWAERKGYEVAPRGRIKQEIVDLYHSRAGR